MVIVALKVFYDLNLKSIFKSSGLIHKVGDEWVVGPKEQRRMSEL